jgi:hypothetical protein
LGSSDRMAGAFLDGAGRQLALGPGSQREVSGLPPKNPDGASLGDVACFGIRSNGTVLVRVPQGASVLALTAPDSYWSDNISNGFKLRVTRPNLSTTSRRAPVVAADFGSTDSHGGFQEWIQRFADRVDPSVLSAAPIAVSYAKSPIPGEGSTPYEPQWRGWYGTWAPSASAYGQFPQRPNFHYGWDLFCPFGTALQVPLVPCRVRTITTNPLGFGLAIACDCKVGTKVVTVVYAHLSSVQVANGTSITSLGTVIARSGCSGNAGAGNCGQDGPTDARTDHVHVQVYVTSGGTASIVDPKTELSQWNIKTPR